MSSTDADVGLHGHPQGADVPPSEPGPPPTMGPGDWARRNLFGSVLDTLLTIVLAVGIGYLGFRLLRWAFITADWEPVRRNLALFMEGQFPRDEEWRLVASTLLIAAAVGAGTGAAAASASDDAEEQGRTTRSAAPLTTLRRFWPLLLFVGTVLLAARTLGPWLLAAAAVVVGMTARAATSRLPTPLRTASWGATALLGLASFQVVSGPGGRAWYGPAIVLGVGAWAASDRLPAWPATARLAARLAAVLATALAVRLFYLLPFMDFGGVPWSRWSGLFLSLFATVVAITLAFPIGLLLALGRRSPLPVFRWLSITYIEFVRGVPLITLLLTAQFFIGFFIPTDRPLDLLTRALIAMTLFTAAYIAEIVRGGLQAVPVGQVEAGQALGLSPFAVTRLVVLPQALRAVIPAMVGQFISLFKDTSLLAIIGIVEFLGVRGLVHAQRDFRIGYHAMTLAFIAFGYWAFSYTMSRESRRIERRLGVGER